MGLIFIHNSYKRFYNDFLSLLFSLSYFSVLIFSSLLLSELLNQPIQPPASFYLIEIMIVNIPLLSAECLLIIVFFLKIKIGIFLNSASSTASLVFYLPCVCSHTDTEGKQNILKSSKKQYLMNTLYKKNKILFSNIMFFLKIKKIKQK